MTATTSGVGVGHSDGVYTYVRTSTGRGASGHGTWVRNWWWFLLYVYLCSLGYVGYYMSVTTFTCVPPTVSLWTVYGRSRGGVGYSYVGCRDGDNDRTRLLMSMVTVSG